jgi:hypothetical protein
LDYHKNLGYLILELLNDNFLDIFNDLIISIFNGTGLMRNDDESSSKFLEVLYSWNEFFLTVDNQNLSEEEVRGLWGELYVLIQIIENGRQGSINKCIESWKGPFKKSHDFELEDKSLEVKTKMLSSHSVSISSIAQLENIGEGGLHLLVVSIDNSRDGESLEALVIQIRSLIHSRGGNLALFFRALAALKLDLLKLKEYDGFKYEFVSIDKYDCLKEGFPRLTRGTFLPLAVIEVKYRLELKRMENYLIKEEEYDY